jgi:hypothetical protein
MSSSRAQRLTRPLAEVRQRIECAPKRTIGVVVAAAVVIAIGIWVWPEVQRTIRIHRM